MGEIPFIVAMTSGPIVAFRTRTHEEDIYYTNIKDVSITPAMYVKNYGRCNIPYQSVFYCSDFRPTSYLELLQYWVEEKTKTPILHATISKWRFQNPFRVLVITSPDPQQRVSNYDITQGKALDEFLVKVSEETREALVLFYQFLFDRFRLPAKHDLRTYIITSAYCNLAVMKDAMDAVYYPSVPYEGKGVNLAFRTYYDFSTNAVLETVARDTFERDDSGDMPAFKQIHFKQAETIDIPSQTIVW